MNNNSISVLPAAEAAQDTSQIGTDPPEPSKITTYGIYYFLVAASICLWFIAFRSPLWLDETDSYWQISAGFSQIWHRQFESLCFPAYTYILWLSTKIIGTSGIALRIPSVLAIFATVYCLYLAARELFDRETAIIAAIVFCAQPLVIVESIDARPYPFGALATSAAILILIRLRRNDSNWLAILLGLCSASIIYFHYLFASILPALAICFFIVNKQNQRVLGRQLGIALGAFTLAFLPTLPGLLHLFSAPHTHVFETAPTPAEFLFLLAPFTLLFAIGALILFALLVAATTTTRPEFLRDGVENWKIFLCASFALTPLLILYGISATTSIHMFAARHCFEAAPGIALCWALVISRLRPPLFRLLFCVLLVAITGIVWINDTVVRQHDYTWKYALDVAQKEAAPDNAPVLICSDIPEADYQTMPLDSAKSSHLFVQLSFYKLSVPVVPLPRALNGEAIQVGSNFLREVSQKHQRFLALAAEPSFKTLDWFTRSASQTYDVRKLGIYDRVEVLEFTPRAQPAKP